MTMTERPPTRWADHNARMRDRGSSTSGPVVFDGRRRVFLVPSASVAGRRYDVRVEAMTGLARVGCSCPAGHTQVPLGSTPCHHGAAGCLEMERAGLLAWTGAEWVTTDVAPKAPPAPGPDAVRRPCAGCGRDIDPDCLIPVEQQLVRAESAEWHRGCRP